LPPDRIRAAVQHVGDGQAAGQIAIDVDVGRIEDVFDTGHRADRRPAFVDRIGRDVRMTIDDARRHEPARRIDDVGARGNRDVLSDRRDLSAAQDDGAVLDGALRHGDDRRVADGDDGVGRSRLRARAIEHGGGEPAEHEAGRHEAACHRCVKEHLAHRAASIV
jgi:hypothetical protein